EGGTPGRDMKVTQYITNGLEILDETVWLGTWIPIVGVWGEELYVEEGGVSRRKYLSLISRAMTAQKMLAYTASAEAQEFRMMPRAPQQGYKGQFDPEQMKDLHERPRAYVEYLIPANWNTAWGPPPLPTRPQFTPNWQAYEATYERWRRGVLSALGVTPAPTAAQRQNEKSGVALERLQQEAAVGSYHITDNLERAITLTGRQVNQLITKLAMTGRIPILKQDESHGLLSVITEEQLKQQQFPEGHPEPKEGTQDGDDYLVIDRGEFDVTFSMGQSYQSERDAQSDFRSEERR